MFHSSGLYSPNAWTRQILNKRKRLGMDFDIHQTGIRSSDNIFAQRWHSFPVSTDRCSIIQWQNGQIPRRNASEEAETPDLFASMSSRFLNSRATDHCIAADLQFCTRERPLRKTLIPLCGGTWSFASIGV